MTIRLRAHHLLCLLTWAGKGYSPAFTAGFTAIAGRIAAGEAVMMVNGPDDICAPMLADPGCHCRGGSVARRDAQAARDLTALLGRPLTAGQRLVLDPATLARMRHAFAGGAIRDACAGCEWSGLCRDIADDGFAGTVLPAPQPDRLRA
ncbi:DUF1284 domain-containing protein [Paracoccus sp. WLY502]|uniref:DUF1284 domain-containing protein n=1 Tax=Paracoccus yibinensis TaxID=3068891 RepID=UPI002796C70E|nr:DUF1284 domain-containing protein [Paracoccus sp. WLY502]MDQ1901747.1 DUF1284 domain-containing protein [Paracoccus sp. WLY502]